MGKYRVAYATGSRADYGIVKNFLRLLDNDKDIEFSVLVTGSHLEDKFGHSVDIIRQDGFKIDLEIPLNIENDSNANVMHCMATALDCFGNYFENNKFDLLIILGDRYEMMAVAIAAAMQRIPILHLHGGEVTYGNYDEFIRHSITKMSQYHFTSTEEYRKRVIQLGEDPKRVFYLGALGAENCCKIDEEKVIEKVKEFIPQKYWVVAFHPETLTDVKMEDQVKEVLTALQKNLDGMSVIFMGTNADTKSDIIRSSWLNYVDEHENAYYYENLNVDSFLYLVKNSIALIGNSSSGIIETPSLGRYTINIGDRQRGRVHGNSVIDVTCDSSIIGQAMKEITGKSEEIINPYSSKSTHNRRERPVHGHRGGSRGRFYYRITTFEGRPWDARDPYKTTFMALKHEIRLSIWRKQKETPGVEKAPGVSSPQRKESGRSGRDDGELRFWVRPGHPRKAVTSISQAEALAHGLTHLHHLVFAAVLARELDWCAALQDAREDARPWGVVGIGLRSDVWVEVRRDDHRPAVLVTRVDDVVDMPHDVIGAAVRPQVVDDEEVILEEARLRVLALVERHRLDVGHDVLHAGLQRGEPEVDDPVGDCRGIERLTCAHLSPEEQPIHVIA